MAERDYYGIRAASAVDALSIAAANRLIREMKLLLADSGKACEISVTGAWL